MAEQVTGDPTDPATTYGPLSSEQAAQNLMDQIDDAISKGATVHLGGHRVDRPGAFVEATVLTDVTPEMRAYREELFGPAAVVYRVADADEAVELANDSAFGLGGAVFSSDEALALDVADRLDTGMVWINAARGRRPGTALWRHQAFWSSSATGRTRATPSSTRPASSTRRASGRRSTAGWTRGPCAPPSRTCGSTGTTCWAC